MRNVQIVKWFALFWILLEVAGFIWVSEWIGLGWTLLLIIGSMFLGVALLRREGFRAANAMMSKIRSGIQLSAEDLVDMPFVLLGAILLIVPGFFSDLLGLLCFIPIIRRYFAQLLSKLSQRASVNQHTRVNSGRTYEGEYRKED